MNRGHLEVQRE